MPRTLTIVLSSLLITLSPAAKADDALSGKILTCKKIEDAEKRLSCFDAILPDEKADNTQASVEKNTFSSNKDLGSSNKDLGSSNKGLSSSNEDLGAENLKDYVRPKAEEKSQSLTSGLIEFGTNRNRKYFFVLSNGQVWTQIQSDTSKVHLPKDLSKVTVSIQRNGFGGYSLRVEGRKRPIKVKRLR